MTRRSGEPQGERSVVPFADLLDECPPRPPRRRTPFEDLAQQVWRRSLEVASDEIDREIQRVLEQIGVFFGADRCAIAEFEGDAVRLTHVWLAPQRPPLEHRLPASILSAMARSWRAGVAFHFSSRHAEEAPLSDDDRAALEQLAVRSLLTVPMQVGGELIGGLGIDSSGASDGWSEVDVARIRFLSEVLSSAMVRKRTEERLRQITDALPAFISYLDANHRYHFANAEYERSAGVSRDEIVGRHIRDVWGEEMFASVQGALQEVLAGQQRTFELLLPSRGGTRKHTQVNLIPRFQRDGRVVGYYVLGSDIGDRVKAEQALQDQLAFERLISGVSARFVNTPPEEIDGEIQHCLRLLGEFFRVDRCAVVQLTGENGGPQPTHVWIAPHVDPQRNWFRQSSMERMVRAWREGEAFQVSDWQAEEHVGESEDQRERNLPAAGRSTLSVPLRVGGLLLGGMGISSFSHPRSWSADSIERMRFVGEIFANALARRHTEQRLQQQQNELTHVARLSTMGEMAAGLAHELNQPLAAIAAFADGASMRLKSGTTDAAELVKIVDRIAADAQRAGEVIRRLRHFVRPRETERQPLDLNGIIRETCRFVSHEAAQHSVAIELQLADQLARVRADPVGVQQVVLNLLRNALESATTQDNARRLVVRTGPAKRQGHVEVVVDDSGRGIAPHRRELVFEPFQTSKSEGLGMGLAISRSIIQSHGGRIWIEDSAEGGASVRFCLPIAKELPGHVD